MSWKQRNEKKITLYHYTDQESAAQIRYDGQIAPSAKGVFGGDKVYLTKLNPSEGKAAISYNNYGPRAGPRMEEKGSVDAVIKVRVPESQVSKVETNDGRDVYVYEGPLDLHKK